MKLRFRLEACGPFAHPCTNTQRKFKSPNSTRVDKQNRHSHERQ